MEVAMTSSIRSGNHAAELHRRRRTRNTQVQVHGLRLGPGVEERWLPVSSRNSEQPSE